MKFKNLNIVSDFKNTITAKVCYITHIDMKNGAISKVYYYRNENNQFVKKSAETSWFAAQLIKNVFVAFCGKEVNNVLTEIAKVLPMVKDNKPYLTTMVDDDDTNNLVTLSDYYK